MENLNENLDHDKEMGKEDKINTSSEMDRINSSEANGRDAHLMNDDTEKDNLHDDNTYVENNGDQISITSKKSFEDDLDMQQEEKEEQIKGSDADYFRD